MLKNLPRSTLISLEPIQLTRPDLDCAEISLFGPGVGECIVLHVGNGRWFIIDSCLCPETKQPIALRYLASIGVDVERQVVGILITHWHSDHIKGASTLLKACKKATLFCSSALDSTEAYYLASLYKKDVFANTDKEIAEFGEIVQFLVEQKARERLDPVKAKHTFFDFKGDVPARLVAMSPSTVAVTQAISNLQNIKPKAGSNRVRNVVPESENLNAVAIHFTFGGFSAVLGSDLEETGNNKTGWSAVFQSNIVEDLSLAVSSLYKVSHHGSKNGHHDRIWSELLVDSPLSIATPYTRSGLPTSENISRVKALSSAFLVTRRSNSGKKTKRDRMVDREMKAVVKDRKIINDKMGHIQIRIINDDIASVAVNDACAEYLHSGSSIESPEQIA